MTTIYLTSIVFAVIIIALAFFIKKLVKNKPNIVKQAPDKSHNKQQTEQAQNRKSEEQQKHAQLLEDNKIKALKQLKQFGLNHAHVTEATALFVDRATGKLKTIPHEDQAVKTIQTMQMKHHIVDANYPFNKVAKTLKNKKNIYFYVDVKSDGIFHQRSHNKESIVTVRYTAWD